MDSMMDMFCSRPLKRDKVEKFNNMLESPMLKIFHLRMSQWEVSNMKNSNVAFSNYSFVNTCKPWMSIKHTLCLIPKYSSVSSPVAFSSDAGNY